MASWRGECRIRLHIAVGTVQRRALGCDNSALVPFLQLKPEIYVYVETHMFSRSVFDLPAVPRPRLSCAAAPKPFPCAPHNRTEHESGDFKDAIRYRCNNAFRSHFDRAIESVCIHAVALFHCARRYRAKSRAPNHIDDTRSVAKY